MNLALLHLCDSLFPVGAFAYSDGLESAVASGQVASTGELRDWIAVSRDETFGRCEGPAASAAWAAIRREDWSTLAETSAELHAIRPSAAARRSSRAMGAQLLRTWQTLHGSPKLAAMQRLIDAGELRPAFPVAFACACATSGTDRRDAVEAYGYTRLAATISAAMRLMPVGHTEAHALLADALADVPAIVDRILARPEPMAAFTPIVDVAAMTHRGVHSRMFRS